MGNTRSSGGASSSQRGRAHAAFEEYATRGKQGNIAEPSGKAFSSERAAKAFRAALAAAKAAAEAAAKAAADGKKAGTARRTRKKPGKLKAGSKKKADRARASGGPGPNSRNRPGSTASSSE